MNRFVLDASVAMTWCFRTDGSPYASRVLDALQAAQAVVPSIWPLEVANALLVAERRRRIGPAEVAHFVSLLEQLEVEADPQTLRRAWRETLSLARRFSLSSYDAAYLELAMREELPLATLDSALRKAAKAAGVKVL